MIFITGASGFVGGHLLDYLISRGQRVRCLARSEHAGKALAARGAEVISGDVTRPETLQGILQADDFIVHLVGIIAEKRNATFPVIHTNGTANLVAEAQRAGVRHFFYQSALGADRGAWSGYLRTKAEAEEIVRESGIRYTIFRPSLIIGPWDGFTRRLVDMLRLSPLIPLPGEGKAKFQPVYIKDWLTCIGKVIDDPGSFLSTYEIGGPEHISYREMVETLSRVLGRRKPAFTIPMGIMKLGALVFETVLSSPPVTTDQLRLLEQDNISDPASVEKNFGFVPMQYEAALREFLSA